MRTHQEHSARAKLCVRPTASGIPPVGAVAEFPLGVLVPNPPLLRLLPHPLSLLLRGRVVHALLLRVLLVRQSDDVVYYHLCG